MEVKEWKLIDKEYLFRKPPWLTIRRDRIQSPTGVVMDNYYVLEYPTWVNVIALTKDGLFVFVRQYRHALGEVNYELSAGVCDDSDPSTLMSAQRELLEETGYGGGRWQEWMVNCANPGTHTNLTHCFLAEGVEKIAEQQLDDTEEMSIHLLSGAEVLNLLKSDAIRQSLHAAALWKYFALKD